MTARNALFLGGPLHGQTRAIEYPGPYFTVAIPDPTTVATYTDEICAPMRVQGCTEQYVLHQHSYYGWVYVYGPEETQIMRGDARMLGFVEDHEIGFVEEAPVEVTAAAAQRIADAFNLPVEGQESTEPALVEVDATRFCEACDVYWTGGKHCWSCGEERPPAPTRTRPRITSQAGPGHIGPYGPLA